MRTFRHYFCGALKALTGSRSDFTMALPITISKDRIYRVTNREPVNKDTTYVTCTCKGCGQPMYLFYVSKPPASPLMPIIGEGHLSVPCRHSKHDALYAATEFFLKVAELSFSATYEPRVDPSVMPRQPLLRTKYKNAKPTFGPHSLEDRPKAAALIARIIGLSSEIDAVTASLLGSMMKANTALRWRYSCRCGKAEFRMTP
jgi:hypothetical protein